VECTVAAKGVEFGRDEEPFGRHEAGGPPFPP